MSGIADHAQRFYNANGGGNISLAQTLADQAWAHVVNHDPGNWQGVWDNMYYSVTHLTGKERPVEIGAKNALHSYMDAKLAASRPTPPPLPPLPPSQPTSVQPPVVIANPAQPPVTVNPTQPGAPTDTGGQIPPYTIMPLPVAAPSDVAASDTQAADVVAPPTAIPTTPAPYPKWVPWAVFGAVALYVISNTNRPRRR